MSVCAICWTVLWGAKTQQLLSGMCIPMGRSRKALSQLVVAFPTRQGRVCPACGQLHSLLVLGIHFRADVLPVMGWGHREGGLQGMGWKHTWHWLMPVAEPLQSIRLTCLCPAAMAVPSCHLPSPMWASARSLRGQQLQEWAKKPHQKCHVHLFFMQPFLPSVRNGTSCELETWNSNTWHGHKVHIRD